MLGAPDADEIIRKDVASRKLELGCTSEAEFPYAKYLAQWIAAIRVEVTSAAPRAQAVERDFAVKASTTAATAPLGAQVPLTKPAGTPAAAPKRSWMGPIAGLAAGLGLAALKHLRGLARTRAQGLADGGEAAAPSLTQRWAARLSAAFRHSNALRLSSALGAAEPERQRARDLAAELAG